MIVLGFLLVISFAALVVAGFFGVLYGFYTWQEPMEAAPEFLPD